jgi:hypothetical protein
VNAQIATHQIDLLGQWANLRNQVQNLLANRKALSQLPKTPHSHLLSLNLHQMLRNGPLGPSLNRNVVNAANIPAILVLSLRIFGHSNRIPLVQKHPINLPMSLGDFVCVKAHELILSWGTAIISPVCQTSA